VAKEFGTQFQGEVPPHFGDTRISLKRSVGYVERTVHAKNQLGPFSRFDTIPAYVTDRRADTERRQRRPIIYYIQRYGVVRVEINEHTYVLESYVVVVVEVVDADDVVPSSGERGGHVKTNEPRRASHQHVPRPTATSVSPKTGRRRR